MAGSGEPDLQTPSTSSLFLMATGPAVLFDASQLPLLVSAGMGGKRKQVEDFGV